MLVDYVVKQHECINIYANEIICLSSQGLIFVLPPGNSDLKY